MSRRPAFSIKLYREVIKPSSIEVLHEGSLHKVKDAFKKINGELKNIFESGYDLTHTMTITTTNTDTTVKFQTDSYNTDFLVKFKLQSSDVWDESSNKSISLSDVGVYDIELYNFDKRPMTIIAYKGLEDITVTKCPDDVSRMFYRTGVQHVSMSQVSPHIIDGLFTNSDISSFDINLSNVTSLSNVWANCGNITSFPQIDTSNVLNFSNAWYECASLTSFPMLDVSNGTDFSNAWYNCHSLTSFPALNASNGTNFSYAWYRCYNLTSFPVLDVSNGTNFSYAWQYCHSLTSFPVLDVSNGTNFSYAWQYCQSITSFPNINSIKGTQFRYTFKGCSNLVSIESIDTRNSTNSYGMFDYCTSLEADLNNNKDAIAGVPGILYVRTV